MELLNYFISEIQKKTNAKAETAESIAEVKNIEQPAYEPEET